MAVVVEEVKRLEGWMTFTEAGKILGFSKQRMHHIVFSTRRFNVSDDVRAIGERPTMLIRTSAVLAEQQRRQQEAAEAAAAPEPEPQVAPATGRRPARRKRVTG